MHTRNMGSPAKRLCAVALIGAASVGLLSSSASGLPEDAGLSCVDVWGEARYRNYGYDHIVHVLNRCSRTVTCDVSTNVNPEAQRVSVFPDQDVEVLTFRGSPSREFVPQARCWW